MEGSLQILPSPKIKFFYFTASYIFAMLKNSTLISFMNKKSFFHNIPFPEVGLISPRLIGKLLSSQPGEGIFFSSNNLIYYGQN
jgi:hypothetical protein